MSWETICSTSQVSEEYPVGVKVAGKDIGVFLVDGEYLAIENVCPHAYALLSQGFVDNGEVECPLHEAVFDLRSGHCLRGPGGRNLATYRLRVQGDDVQIDTTALLAKEGAAA
jgi:nitrite reductase/ring-hydroxylating ferredoxin subunit